MNGPSKSDFKQVRFDWMESGIVFAGLLVVGGLLMESLPEIKSAVAERRFPNLTVTGGVIVTIGVLVEVVLGIFITQRANRGQSEANERVVKAEQATAEANLARVKLEQKFKPRKPSRESLEDITELLRPHTGLRIQEPTAITAASPTPDHESCAAGARKMAGALSDSNQSSRKPRSARAAGAAERFQSNPIPDATKISPRKLVLASAGPGLQNQGGALCVAGGFDSQVPPEQQSGRFESSIG